MAKTRLQFDEWLANKHPRQVGKCSECGQVNELRQLKPTPLCGSCYMDIYRQEKKDADPLAHLRDAKKRAKKIRSEMNKVLNSADAVDGLIEIEDRLKLEEIAKRYLQPIIGAPGEPADGIFVHSPDTLKTIADGADIQNAGDSVAGGADAMKPSLGNRWYAMTRQEQKQFAAEKLRAKLARDRAE